MPSVIDCALKSEGIQARKARKADLTASTDVIYAVVRHMTMKDEDYARAKCYIVQAVKYGNVHAVKHSSLLRRNGDSSEMYAAVAEALVADGEAIKHLTWQDWTTETAAKHVLLAMKTFPDAKHYAHPLARDLISANSELIAKHYDQLVKLLQTNLLQTNQWDDF